MDVVKFVDSALGFCKEKINKALDIWESFDEDEKRLYIGCAAVVLTVIVVVSVAYSLGNAHGRRVAIEDEEF